MESHRTATRLDLFAGGAATRATPIYPGNVDDRTRERHQHVLGARSLDGVSRGGEGGLSIRLVRVRGGTVGSSERTNSTVTPDRVGRNGRAPRNRDRRRVPLCRCMAHAGFLLW